MHYGIIAAGEGSRLAQEGASNPKPLINIGGEPMLGRLVKIFTDCGAESISIIVNEEMTEVQEFARKLAAESKVPVNLTVKSTPSSMHSFYEISRSLKGKGRFIATTVDTIFRPEDFSKYAEAFQNADPQADGMMAMTSYIDDEKPLYIETNEDNDIVAFRDEVWSDAKYISGGIYGLNGQAIDVLEDCMAQGVMRMRNFQRALIAAGLNIKGFDFGKILDVDHVGDIEKAEAFLSGI